MAIHEKWNHQKIKHDYKWIKKRKFQNRSLWICNWVLPLNQLLTSPDHTFFCVSPSRVPVTGEMGINHISYVCLQCLLREVIEVTAFGIAFHFSNQQMIRPRKLQTRLKKFIVLYITRQKNISFYQSTEYDLCCRKL